MNCKEFSSTITPSNHRVYYAPAASTYGDKVKIYRHSLIGLCREYHNEAALAPNKMAATRIRYQWAKLLADQLPYYSGDRYELFEFAKKLAHYVYHTLSDARDYERYRFYIQEKNRNKRFVHRVCSDNFFEEARALALRFGGYF